MTIKRHPLSQLIFTTLTAAGIIMSTSLVYAEQNGQKNTVKYFRHLVYNHVSPFIDIKGNYEINKDIAVKTQHYIFTYNDKNQLIEIINNNPSIWKKHPLANFGDAYTLKISYSGSRQIFTFFNKDNEQIKGIRGAYKEVFEHDSQGHKKALYFYDKNDKPMESSWNIAYYTWEKKGTLIIEKRYGLKSDLIIPVSPYFPFFITGIDLDKNGLPKAHYNLNEKYEIIENTTGIASYKDMYDANNNHIQYSYYDKQNNLVLSSSGFAIGKKDYDSNGDMIRESFFDEKNTLRKSKEYRYNEDGNLK